MAILKENVGGTARMVGVRGPMRPTYSETIGSAGAGTYTVTHDLGTTDVDVTVRRVANGTLGAVAVGWHPATPTTVTLDFGTYVRAAGEFRVTVRG